MIKKLVLVLIFFCAICNLFARIVTPINQLEKIGICIHAFYMENGQLPTSLSELRNFVFLEKKIELKKVDDKKLQVTLKLDDEGETYILNYEVSDFHNLFFYKNKEFYGSCKIDTSGTFIDIVAANKKEKKCNTSSDETFVPVTRQSLCGAGVDFTDFAD